MDRRSLLTKAPLVPLAAGGLLLAEQAVDPDEAEAGVYVVGSNRYRVHNSHNRRVYLTVALKYDDTNYRMRGNAICVGERYSFGSWIQTNFSIKCRIELFRGQQVVRYWIKDASGSSLYNWNTNWKNACGGCGWVCRLQNIRYGIGGHWHTATDKYSDWFTT